MGLPLQGCEMKKVKRGPAAGDGDDEDDLWGDTNGWGHNSDGEADAPPVPARDDEDVSMETWIIMELCNRGSLRVRRSLTLPGPDPDLCPGPLP